MSLANRRFGDLTVREAMVLICTLDARLTYKTQILPAVDAIIAQTEYLLAEEPGGDDERFTIADHLEPPGAVDDGPRLEPFVD